MRFGKADKNHALLSLSQTQVENAGDRHRALAHGFILTLASQGDAVTESHIQRIGQTPADQDHIFVLILQEAPRYDILCNQADWRFGRCLYAGDRHRVTFTTIVDHAAGVDAFGCQQHLWMCHGDLHHFIGVFHRQQR